MLFKYLWLLGLSITVLQYIYCDNSLRSEKQRPTPLTNLLLPGKCKHTWRIDPQAALPGRCLAGVPHKELPGLSKLEVRSFKECRSLCCNLGEECNTWQYQNSTGVCKIEKQFVRRGPEGANTILYCDPFPPIHWNGQMLKERLPDGSCVWAHTLPSQCFGFGMEKKSSSGQALNADDCKQACCSDSTCTAYQEYPGRGCYYGNNNCAYAPVEGAFEGGRKCAPGFCGGWEERVLKRPRSPASSSS